MSVSTAPLLRRFRSFVSIWSSSSSFLITGSIFPSKPETSLAYCLIGVDENDFFAAAWTS